MKTKFSLAFISIFAAALSAISALAAHNEDQRIISAVKNSYVYRTYLKEDKIKIDSRDGVVTLQGEVFTPTHKAMAEDTVEGLPGVKSVNNRLEVSGKPADEKSDDWLTFKVRSALLYHRNVSGTKTQVSARDGVITLRGVASTDAQKELTTEYARDIEGVKEVKNEMTVAAEPPGRTVGEVVDDASVTAQVKSALFTHRSTSAVKTKAITRNGIVTLSGTAQNPAEKDLVTKLVSDIHGVKSVVNNMEVKE
jgi:hyperosmotically inducible periplasmic protein